MHHQIGEHPQWVWPIVGTVHSDTLITTWGVMLFSLIFFAWLGLSYRSSASVRRTQATFEGIVNWLADLAIGTIGRRGERFVPVFVSIFIFIFLLNQIGFFPFKELGLPFGGSPTADLNTTLAYALIVYVGIWITAIARGGIGAFKHLLQPFPILLPINLIEDLARPITLSLRLFFNIFVGELLIYVAVQIITSGVHIGAFDLSLAAALMPFLIQFFNFFIGTLQAFVFTLLSIVYLSLATAEEH
ncbi:MAG TPA: F0F1 ATP synthase subunit A [Candidatus Acidoferrales bacterium]|nr:F0F1 ATP synthase subunit A [Candidatus Acidoferrales bacterium]